LHTLSTSPHHRRYEQDLDHYDDIEDNDSIDKSMHRHQADNISIATSLFTAVDHMEPQQEDEDDSSSTENTRHGYLPTLQYDDLTKEAKSVNALIKKLNIQSSVQWEGKTR
jgi:hypothetical protein